MSLFSSSVLRTPQGRVGPSSGTSNGKELCASPGRVSLPRKPIDVVVLALPSAGLINLFGPTEVFLEANSYVKEPIYRVQIVSPDAQSRAIGAGAILLTDAIGAEPPRETDTLILAGGFQWPLPMETRNVARLLDWIKSSGSRARRIGALCSGSMLLAEAGFLRRRHATTHWACSEQMSDRYPDVSMHRNRIYMKDGKCYTAAGGAAAIDLALALVEEDLGAAVAQHVAKRMVVFLRRPGTDSQLSSTLLAQRAPTNSISDLLVWMADNLDKDLSVPSLARRVAMSPRNFARSFRRIVGKTPGRHLNDLRLEAALRHLGDDASSLEDVARATGFGSVEVFRRFFTKQSGTSPGRFRHQTRARIEFHSHFTNQ